MSWLMVLDSVMNVHFQTIPRVLQPLGDPDLELHPGMVLSLEFTLVKHKAKKGLN